MARMFSLLVLLVTCFPFSFSGGAELPHSLPAELAEIAKRHDCAPDTRHYKQMGWQRPIYAYGVHLQKIRTEDDFFEQENSAVFVCKSNAMKYTYFMILMIKGEGGYLNECPRKIDIGFSPGGVGIFRGRMSLEGFRYVGDKQKKIQAGVFSTRPIIVVGVETHSYYYCDKGKWIFKHLD